MESVVIVVDYEMLISLKAGNNGAFDFFYKKYRGKIYANILKLTKSPEFAADILQEVFVAIWKNRAHIDVKQPFEHYIFQIARNKVFDFFRKASRDKKLTEKLILLSTGQEYNPLEDEFHLKEDFGLLDREIERLPEKCKQVFKLCKIEGKSYDEVAQLLNISAATVNNHIVRATRILKKNLSRNSFLSLMLIKSLFEIYFLIE